LFDGFVEQLMSGTGDSPSFRRDAMSDLEVTSPTTDRGTYRPYKRRPLVMRGEERVREERIGKKRRYRRGGESDTEKEVFLVPADTECCFIKTSRSTHFVMYNIIDGTLTWPRVACSMASPTIECSRALLFSASLPPCHDMFKRRDLP
jgi:hypothetical protein